MINSSKVLGIKIHSVCHGYDIEDYADVLRVEGKAIETPVSKNTYICGYEVDVPADKELILITTIM